jgi:CDP-diacylglycerol--glycerol-3-phosphate 3-phosphatidyltransferase
LTTEPIDRKLLAVTITTANKITILRIVLVPAFVVALLRYTSGGSDLFRWLAIAIFVIAALGDGIDGYVARRFHQCTELGAALDPLADKLLLVLGLVVLTLNSSPHLNRIPLWLTATVLSRDVLLLLLTVLIAWIVGHGKVRPRWTGKTATVLQMTCVLWALFKLSPRWLDWIAAAATLGTAVSGIQSLRDGIRQLQPQPQPTPPK